MCHGQVRRVVRVEDSEMWGRYVDQRHRLTYRMPFAMCKCARAGGLERFNVDR